MDNSVFPHDRDGARHLRAADAPEARLHSRAKGASAEDATVEYLSSKGFAIIARNFRTRNGEIDIIARDADGTLVFVEVKSARTGSCGHPFWWVTRAKQRTLVNTAKAYLSKHEPTGCPCRFDVIAVYNGRFEHLTNAFLAQ